MKTVNKADFKEEKENMKNTRGVLKMLQKTSDNEILAGRTLSGKEKSSSTKHKTEVADKAVQTAEGTITAEDLISSEPSAEYWKKLAQKREELLNESFQDNERLKEAIEALEDENKICKDMLNESQHLVEVLQEIVGSEGTEGATEESC